MTSRKLTSMLLAIVLLCAVPVSSAFADDAPSLPDGQTGSGATGTDVQVDLGEYGVASDKIENFSMTVDINDPSLAGAAKTQDDPAPLYAAAGVLGASVLGAGGLVVARRRK